MSSSSASTDIWIYHERQEALLCGQHALNNLVQDAAFTPSHLAEIALQLDQMELNYMAENNEGGVRSKEYLQRIAEGSANVDPSGNFSIEVLRAALKSRYELELPSLLQDDMIGKEVTDMMGFICHRADHWFALRKIGNNFWNLNSTLERPVPISHFTLATEIRQLQNEGYSVFCVPEGLPLAGKKRDFKVSAHSNWWLERDLLAGVSNARNDETKDPWENVGSGMRLDGKATAAMSSSSSGNAIGIDLTEEEMIQLAMAESLQIQSTPAPAPMELELSPEPPVGAEDAVKVSFRLPSKSGLVKRRFNGSDPVGMLYTFAKEACDGRSVDLRHGYPPKNLSDVRDQTLAEASLGGECIQGRFV